MFLFMAFRSDYSWVATINRDAYETQGTREPILASLVETARTFYMFL